MIEIIIIGLVALLGLFAIIVAGYVVMAYNRFIQLKNGIDNSFNQISVGMKKRFDMIGQLVETAKSYLKFEKEVMTDVTKLRAMAISTPADVAKADAMASSILGKITVAVENYPNLRAIESVTTLQASIKDVEDEIARLRYVYNDQVQGFNIMAERVPSNIVARIFGFVNREYLKFEEGIEKRPSTAVA